MIEIDNFKWILIFIYFCISYSSDGTNILSESWRLSKLLRQLLFNKQLRYL